MVTKASIQPSRLDALESGTAESRNHIEQMTMSMGALMAAVFPRIPVAEGSIDSLPFVTGLRTCGALLAQHDSASVFRADATFVSDTVRGWQAMAVAASEASSPASLLRQLDRFITDHHFAVREWVWLAVRPAVVAAPMTWIDALRSLREGADPLRRRFAVEATRPRSVWGTHIAVFKEHPETVTDALETLRCDPDRYVQASVANWLNDASKTRPEWVDAFTMRWSRECSCDSTMRITRAARRSLRPAERQLVP